MDFEILQLNRLDIDYRDYKARSAKPEDYNFLITKPTIGVLNGKIQFIYDVIGNVDFNPLVKTIQKIKYMESERSGGLVTRSRTFGYRPRITFRSDFCSISSLANEMPDEHKIVSDYGKIVQNIYAQQNPETFERHKGLADEKLKDSWRIQDTVFTSGIINKNNPLRYHFDAGNFKDVSSCMLVFKKDVEGGHLALPEFGVGIELVNNSALIFDGQSILHGVTPIRKLSEDAHRYSIVYYSLKSIWNCLEVDDELARIRNVKTNRERVRANMSEELKAEYRKKYAK